MRSFQAAEADIPELFLASSPSMVDLCRNFGDVVCFDITYNLLRERSTRKTQWGLGVFCGFGRNLEIVIFAIYLICNESKDSFKRLFLNYFEMSGRLPSTVLSD
jgi:hypothetical protein